MTSTSNTFYNYKTPKKYTTSLQNSALTMATSQSINLPVLETSRPSSASSTDSESFSTKNLFNFLPMAPEYHVGKKVFGMTAEELNFTEEAFAQLVDNLSENVT
jgi:hypothetical protein